MLGPRHYTAAGRVSLTPQSSVDWWLLVSAISLCLLGLLMVASSSIVIAERSYGQPFYFFLRQLTYLGLGLLFAFLVSRVQIRRWQALSGPILFLVFALLIVVLIPGLGKTVNGSTRWLAIPGFSLQVSEFAKFGLVIFFAGYLVRRQDEVQQQASGFIKALIILGIVAGLLLLEPDFGATVVIVVTVMTMLFLAGARLAPFIGLGVLVTAAGSLLLITSPYRVARVTAFLDPWADQFGSGYQLTQSLIAFGRGGWFGVGLGESVQKLLYLPEAHTDFLFAVLAEELGLIGIAVTLLLFVILIMRGLLIGRRAIQAKQYFSGHLAYGFTLLIGLQAFINMGVNMGVLPTKGLTLPLMSKGGSSLLVCCMIVALLLRIDYETRQHSEA